MGRAVSGTFLAPFDRRLKEPSPMHKTPNPSDPSTPIEEPPQTPEHVPELPPLHDPDPQQEQA
jgi:hypothetical protein